MPAITTLHDSLDRYWIVFWSFYSVTWFHFNSFETPPNEEANLRYVRNYNYMRVCAYSQLLKWCAYIERYRITSCQTNKHDTMRVAFIHPDLGIGGYGGFRAWSTNSSTYAATFTNPQAELNAG